ncbi:MAG: hypothetical protein MJZ95_03525 [Paludibacteraceae bacterium]|nr:hypothetical protein [Paludibacteraceae bacterium]
MKLNDLFNFDEGVDEVEGLAMRHVWKIVLVVAMAIVYIQIGFDYDQQLVDLHDSKERMKEARYSVVYRQQKLTQCRMRSIIKTRLAEIGSKVTDDGEKPISNLNGE